MKKFRPSAGLSRIGPGLPQVSYIDVYSSLLDEKRRLAEAYATDKCSRLPHPGLSSAGTL